MVERFLLLFRDYRDALDRAQRAEDAVQRERGIAEETQARLDAVTQEFLAREREMTDRAMRIRFGDRIVQTPEQIAAALGQVEPRAARQHDPSAREWQKSQTAKALQVFDEFAAKVKNGR
jgi:hypothetical protein